MFSLFKCRNCFALASFKHNLARSFRPCTRPWTTFQDLDLCQGCCFYFQYFGISVLSCEDNSIGTLNSKNTNWSVRSAVLHDNMSKRKRDLTRVTVHPSDEPHYVDTAKFDKASTRKQTTNMTSEEMRTTTLSDSDSEIVVVYNYKEERTRTAVEILLDDDGLAVEITPSSSRDVCSRPRPTRVNNDVVMIDSNSSSPSSSNDRHIGVVETEALSNTGSVESELLHNHGSSSSEITPEEIEEMRSKIEQARFWEYTNLGSGLVQNRDTSDLTMFSVMSYNVLSQSLLEAHPHLYAGLDVRTLGWEHRSEILLKEFTLANADILCLQEVQESHMNTFYNRLNGLGYEGVFKKRTGDKGDGVAIYYKKSMFTLRQQASVEYYQPGVSVLNRDNVGLIVRLAVNGRRQDREVVVATTHLLYNPGRHDVKLAQAQLLLAEVERFAFVAQDRYNTPMYCPSIITGDLNLEPYSGVYRLLTTGMLRFAGLSSSDLCDEESYRPLGTELIPRVLEVTDTCQHFGILVQRPARMTHDEQRETIKLYHSDYSKYRSYKDYVSTMRKEGFVNNFTPQPHASSGKQRVSPEELPPEGFGTGQLSHHLNLRSVYNHGKYGTNLSEVTTFQSEWVTVDYIFYSCKYAPNLDKVIEGQLKLISRLRLPKRVDILHRPKIGRIPNAAAPSDHFPLAAVFLLN